MIKNIWGSLHSKHENPDLFGIIDNVDDTLKVFGWAWDRNNPKRKIKISIVNETGEKITEGIADKFREDLLRNQIGDGEHAFELQLPKEIKKTNIMLTSEDGSFSEDILDNITYEIKNTYSQVTLFNLSKELENKLYENFDSKWFSNTYNFDTDDKKELFEIYKEMVHEHHLSPNKDFNERVYLLKYPDVKESIANKESFCGFAHYLLSGKKEGRTISLSSLEKKLPTETLMTIEALFDETWYIANYPEVQAEIKKHDLTPFRHYYLIGVKKGYNPNDWFDESWYSSFYEDVYKGIQLGYYICGFEHYILKGRFESRASRRVISDILNYKFSEAINPVGFEREKGLERMMKDVPVEIIDSEYHRLVFLLPTMDRDIMFGGYISLINFLKKFLEFGLKINIVITEDKYMCEQYFWYNIKKLIPNFEPYKDQLSFQNLLKEPILKISAKDRFFVYSSWTGLLASKLTKYTDEEKFIFLRQEDERIFHTYDSFHAMIDYVYSLPQIAIFNTKDLHDYFIRNKIGFFKNKILQEKSNIYTFEHVISVIEPIEVKTYKKSKTKNFVFYARPEAHAARNMYELGVVAIKNAIRQGVFNDNWNFFGIGSAKDYDIPLENGKWLQIKSKVSLEEYQRMLKEFDVGMFLMNAPHPGLLGLEMAAAGLISIVNTFDYRNEKYFNEKSANFVVAQPDPYDLTRAIEEAIKKAENIEERVSNIYRPKSRSWDEELNEKFLLSILENANIATTKK